MHPVHASTTQTPLPGCYRGRCTNKEAFESIEPPMALNAAGKTLGDIGVFHGDLEDRIVPDNFLRMRKSLWNDRRRKSHRNMGSGEVWDDLEWELCDRLIWFSRAPLVPEVRLRPPRLRTRRRRHQRLLNHQSQDLHITKH